MRKEYEEPMILLEVFEVADIITLSEGEDMSTTESYNNGGWNN